MNNGFIKSLLVFLTEKVKLNAFLIWDMLGTLFISIAFDNLKAIQINYFFEAEYHIKILNYCDFFYFFIFNSYFCDWPKWLLSILLDMLK